MADHFDQTIAELQKKLGEQEAEVNKTKEMINRLCEFAGRPPLYKDVSSESSNALAPMRADRFYGQPLAKSVREIMEMRNASGIGPASVREIYETLKEGGYQFDAKNDQNAMRGLYISLGKNVAVFHKLPSGKFGLKAWYPKLKGSHGKSQNSDETEGEGEDPAED